VAVEAAEEAIVAPSEEEAAEAVVDLAAEVR